MIEPVVRAAGEGERYWFYGGGVHVWKVTSKQSGGAVFAFEDELVKGKTTPYHAHAEATELVYVLEGEILSRIDGVDHVVGAGGCTMAPAGTPHAFLVTSEKARILTVQVPGSGDAFYMGASDPATPELEASAPLDFERVMASAAATGGMQVLGPPPFKN
jgi:quercetin dioxygenase-like cupin family protein